VTGSGVRRLAAALVAVTVALTACAGSNDREQIDTLVRDHVSEFAAKEAGRFAADFASTCQVSVTQFQRAFAALGTQKISADIRSVTVTSLAGDTATATASGTLTVGLRSLPLSGATGTREFRLVKEGGSWKIANCPASSTATPSG